MSYQVRNAKRALRDTFEARNVNERGECFSGESDRFRTIEVLHAFCEVNNLEIEFACEYGEPGYGPAPKGILFTDWNHVPKSLQDRLEAQGVKLEWSDEWYVDSDESPSKAWRTEGDSMGWEPRTRCMDGYMITPDSDAQEWIDSSLNEPHEPLSRWFDTSELETRGFVMMDDNTNDDIAPVLIKEGFDVVLRRGASDVFHEVWTRREAKRELFLDESRGVYIPKAFAECVDRTRVSGIDMSETLDELAKGPDDCEHYWDIWDDVLNLATVTDTNGVGYRLEQDGDLWLVESAGEFCEHEDKYYTHK